MEDQKAFQKFYRFQPSDESLQGIISTPLMGEVEEGRIYEVNQPMVAEVLDNHPEWKTSSQKHYDDQSKKDGKEVDHAE